MAQAAARAGLRPEDLSFQASWKAWEAVAPALRDADGFLPQPTVRALAARAGARSRPPAARPRRTARPPTAAQTLPAPDQAAPTL